ncbi:hypothetical protein B0T26DRAFT_751559 [Lasiosphaeria miniovina]|uniref:Uncharacterized protein n=1 Tax=Lasiosphaeria miniovina TaxID=1954250 RepID=A0AA40DVU8_9PEZI|nr:uncharacterized protein B0T26DRAFT_751559 [Lasiosphaeria miniovina]KAK0717515.1 hypothetical protein B0T26DRAFT_751559 [Lasiosphaeria miniovina]
MPSNTDTSFLLSRPPPYGPLPQTTSTPFDPTSIFTNTNKAVSEVANTQMKIGLGVGISVASLLTIALVWVLLRRRRRNPLGQNDNNIIVHNYNGEYGFAAKSELPAESTPVTTHPTTASPAKVYQPLLSVEMDGAMTPEMGGTRTPEMEAGSLPPQKHWQRHELG